MFGEHALRGKNMFPRRKQIHLVNFDYTDTNVVYFLTICTYEKKAYFNNPEIAQYIDKEIDYRSRVVNEVVMLAYCIMPDHVHLLLKV